MDKTPEELYKERLGRVEDACQLKVPDRVPVLVRSGLFPARYAGITSEEAYYGMDKWAAASKRFTLDFQPDLAIPLAFTMTLPGSVLQALDVKQIKWPGHGVPSNDSFQFVEAEYMKADEYNAFLNDTTDWLIRQYLPRIIGTLAPFATLPDLKILVFGYLAGAVTSVLSTPEGVAALQSLLAAGSESMKWMMADYEFSQELAKLGFPMFSGGSSLAPFDVISDLLRGMRGAMLDMYRQPDKLLETCEKLLPLVTELGVTTAMMSGTPRVYIPLHRGDDTFMSLKQFETFYWPTLKKLICTLVDARLTPIADFQGTYTSRLEHLLELPKGKVICQFDTTDLFKAKEILAGHLCIQGNVPSSLLQVGTQQEVKDCCKKLIDVVGKGGGYIMSPGCSLDYSKPENVKAMFDFTREYGVYK